MLVDGFNQMPPFNCSYNYPYYPEAMDKLGFEKEADWLLNELDVSQRPSEKFYRLSDMLIKRYGLRILNIKKKSDKEIITEAFFSTYNDSFKDVHNFVPLTDKEILAVRDSYINILKPELNIFIADSDNKLIAFAICFPDMSPAFQKTKGKLFPFGWYHLLKGYLKYRSIDMMLIGVGQEWHTKGVSAILHTALSKHLGGRVTRGVTNPQIETNTAVKIWDNYNHRHYMRRRCYIKDIL